MDLKKPLPPGQQDEFLKIAKDNEEVRNKIIIHNLKLVSWVALKYHKKHKTEYDDLFQLGVLGLMKAIEKYDPARGGSFSSYAVWYIRSSITRNMFLFTDDTSLDAPMPGTEDLTLQDTLHDRTAKTLEEDVEENLLAEQLRKEMKKRLNPEEYEVITMFFGFYGKVYSVKQIAEKINCNRSQVNTIKNRAVRKMRWTTFIVGLKKEVDRNTIFYKSPDFSQKKVSGVRPSSPVERTVIEREKMLKRLIKELEV
ncbi:RNA polymerase sporulation-specific sigma factor [Natronincola peptidivorans]|uniref:RNA polymerase sporulation-specific sigma factor n=1 Tax=Natronincola peptidivorans TaxID=426128 RepID=A0A1I0E1M7_9FIRM|nr:sigma-70 family RNA polymerase sigma factor [Natronincola peptidivorans]SET38625.1 RNA polymerase sporulation-specific sigma factor [Natronincola peptidivorans]